MLDDLDLDFRVSKFNGQLVWHGLGAYSGLASSRRFPSVQAAEEDASLLISHLFAASAESLSVISLLSPDVQPLLSIVHSHEDKELYLLAA